jgi:hypothetical protein
MIAIRDIKFKKRTTHFLGRNGQMKCGGLTLTTTAANSVMIEPFTSKGSVGRALLEVPNEDVPALIKALQSLRSKPVAMSIKEFAQETKLVDAQLRQAFGDFCVQGDSFAKWWAENQGRYV